MLDGFEEVIELVLSLEDSVELSLSELKSDVSEELRASELAVVLFLQAAVPKTRNKQRTAAVIFLNISIFVPFK